MRLSEFWSRMDDEFGAAYAASLARSQVMGELGGRTAVDALEAGARPRDVWMALCAAMDVPEERRHVRVDPRHR